MKIRVLSVFCILFFAVLSSAKVEESTSGRKGKGHHHHHHHHHHHKKGTQKHVAQEQASSNVSKQVAPVATKAQAATVAAQVVAEKTQVVDSNLVKKMKALEDKLGQKPKQPTTSGKILVNGPIPVDFKERFAQAVSHATGCDAQSVVVTKTEAVPEQPGVVAIEFSAPQSVVGAVKEQAADVDSELAKGNMHSFLVEKNDDADNDEQQAKPEALGESDQQREAEGKMFHHSGHKDKDEIVKRANEEEAKISSKPRGREDAAPVEQKGLDIDTAMPYGDLEPFGREDTAQELTEDSISESNQMVDQLERAEVAEEKRAVFRALTRLRGAAITSFDGVARSQTGNIDEYNKIHRWRDTHPLHHLADEESDVSKWAFPDNADF